MITRLSDCGMAISLGPTARLMPAWGIAPESRPPNCSPAPTARFIGAKGACGGMGMARAFSPGCVFVFSWGVAPGWDENAPLALALHYPGLFRIDTSKP